MRLTLRQVLIIGIFVRLVFAVYTQHAATQAKVTNLDELLLVGGNPLVRTTSFGPSFYFFYIPVYTLYWLISTYLGVNFEFIYNALFRVPTLIGDLIITYSLYIIGLRISKQEQKAFVVAAVYFLNPYTIWLSSIVGHAENLMVGFILLSMVYLMEGSIKKSALSFSFATAFRAIPVLSLPFMVYYIYMKKLSVKRYLAVYFVSLIALSAPYIISIVQIYNYVPSSMMAFFDHWVGFGSAVQGTGSYGIESIVGFTYNFTGIIASMGFWDTLGRFFGFRNYLIVLALLGLLMIRNGKGEIRWLNACLAMVYSLLIIFTPLVQHHYLMWAFPFILLAAYIFDDLPKFVPYVLALGTVIIDPIVEGAFYYYPLSTFPMEAGKLQGSWFFRDMIMQLGVSGVQGLLLLFVVTFLLLGFWVKK